MIYSAMLATVKIESIVAVLTIIPNWTGKALKEQPFENGGVHCWRIVSEELFHLQWTSGRFSVAELLSSQQLPKTSLFRLRAGANDL